MKIRKLSKLFCLMTVFLSLLLVFSGCSSKVSTIEKRKVTSYNGSEGEFNSQIKDSSEFTQVEQNEFLSLYVKGKTAEVKIEDKKTGKTYYTNPENRNEYDNIASGEGKDKLSSQINIDYNLNDSPQSYNSYTNSVSNGQVTFEKIERGIRVNYLFGDKPKQYFVPQALSVQRFESILKTLDDENKEVLKTHYQLTTLKGKNKGEQAVLTNMYPILAKHDCYIVMVTSAVGDPNKVYASEYIMTKLHNAFASGGYKKEDYIKDNTENLIKEEVKPDHTVTASVEYIIDGRELSVTIPNDSISFDESQIKVTTISLLPMFGAASDKQNGYIFVPDGTGALINLNNQKYSMPTYNKKLYGNDNTIPLNEIESVETSRIYMPVFGLKADDSAFLSIIEKGDGIAEISAEISGKVNRYNTVFSSFSIDSTSAPQTTSLGLNLGLKYQKQITGSDLAVRYIFLTGEEADYSHMAMKYQNYLLEKGYLKKTEIKDGVPLSVTTIGAVNAKKSVLGIPVDLPVSLTNYKQNIELLEMLKEKGADNIILNLTAWSNNGVFNTNNQKLELIRELGDKKELNELQKYVSEHHLKLYFNADFQYIGKKILTNGFDTSKNAARTLENVTAYRYEYELATKTKNLDLKKYIVSPRAYGSMAERFLQDFSKYNSKSVGLSDIGRDLNGDYNENYFTDRTKTLQIVSETVKSLADKGYDLSVNGGNFYSLNGVSFINDAPINSGKQYLTDSYIPFFQMVLHGIVPYAGEPLNMSASYETDVLRLAETGTIPSFRFIYEDNLTLKDTGYNYYSVCYKSWIDTAAALYQEMNEKLGSLAGCTMIRHETIAEGVKATTFSNQKTVYVNYNDFPVTTNGITIEKKSYEVK